MFLFVPLIVKKTLSVPTEFSQNSKEYSEESIVQCFRESTMEKKETFFKASFTPDTQLKNYPYHVDATEFIEET